MAQNFNLSNTGANAGCNAVAALLNNGYLRIYDGTQPATANTAITTQNLLVELRWNATAFSAASGGSASANAITAGTATATGTATWARFFESNGTTVVADEMVNAGGGAGIVLATASITTGIVVSIDSYVITCVELNP